MFISTFSNKYNK